MEGFRKFFLYRAIACLLVLMTLSGCFGIPAQMMYFIKGYKAKAAFAGLKNKTVAVVCISDASSYGPNSLTDSLARSLGAELKLNVKKLNLIPNSEIEDWKDQNGWAEIQPEQLGRDLGADMVVTLELTGYSIREGQTMYKGRSTITTTVYDVQNNGDIAFVHGPEFFEFPKSHARPAIGTTEAQFEAAYLHRVVIHISRLFYDYDKAEAVGEDAFLF